MRKLHCLAMGITMPEGGVIINGTACMTMSVMYLIYTTSTKSFIRTNKRAKDIYLSGANVCS